MTGHMEDGRAMLHLVVEGTIVPTARTRSNGGHHLTPKTTAEAQARVARVARGAIDGGGWPDRPRGPFRVKVNAFGAPLDCDPDNVAKTVLDGLVKGRALFDDRFRVVRGLRIDWWPEDHRGPRLEIDILPC